MATTSTSISTPVQAGKSYPLGSTVHFPLTRIFHGSHSEAADETRRRQNFDQGCMSPYRSDQNSTTTQYSSALAKLQTERHERSGLGATPHPDGVNFSIFSRHSTSAELLLFDDIKDTQPSRVIKLDPCNNRSYRYWHVFVPGLREGQIYGWRVDGPFNPNHGLRYDATKVLLDPYGKCIAYPPGRDRHAAASVGDNTAKALKNIVINSGTYDWENDAPPLHPMSQTMIYELNVGTFTKNPNSGVSAEKRGTFAGVIEKIPYLKDLGITAVELLPIFAFDEDAAPAGLKNGWGYQPLAFFAPHPQYSSRKEPMAVLDEFRDMVKALHRAGIEVILDVVFNHTAEGGANGPTISFRGLSNETYYILGEDKSTYSDFTGCGNTLNANESIVRRLILDSLSYWVQEMHVDGFRFDLASILSRDEDGTPMKTPPVLWDIESDPVLSTVKLIAEAWDAAGLYQLGSFPGDAWHEWNGKFRDDVRSFIKGDENSVRALAYRMTGSPDLYLQEEREPEQSINFVTCHDGFTLNDLVTYDRKHNEANKEENRDGSDHNLSWNCGVEGPTEDPEIEKLRNRQVKNFLTILFFSIGTPMLLAGDEVRRTQLGNNNAYCDLGESTWFDWSNLEKHADIYRFTKLLIKLRANEKNLCENYEETLQEFLKEKAIEWHGVKLGAPDFEPNSHTIAATMRHFDDQMMLHIMINAYWEDLTFEIPSFNYDHESWHRCIDTSLESPNDILPWHEAPKVIADSYDVKARSVVVLVSSSNPA